MKEKILMMTGVLAIVLISCKKHSGDRPGSGERPPAIPPKQSWIAGLNKEIANVLEYVYENDSAYREVNAAILCGYYEDERVLLRDLLFPERSGVYASESFLRFQVTPGIFKKRFYEQLAIGTYPLLKPAVDKAGHLEESSMTSVLAYDMRMLNDTAADILSGDTAIAIYFPYSENFVDSALASKLRLKMINRPTIVATDRDADTGAGRAPYVCAVGVNQICYRDVVTDDEYAMTNPVHIVAIGARPKQIGYGELPSGSVITRVYHGWSRLTRQMDNLISLTGNGGGSEIKIARLSGYLKIEDQQVTGFSGDVVTINYTRSEIRNAKWKRVFSVWDMDWKPEDVEQVYAVYEDDTKGKKTLTGSITTTVNLPGKPSVGKIVGDIGYKVEVETQDDIITQRKIEREAFFSDGMNNQGWGFLRDGNDFLPLNRDWPIFDGGTIWQYTMAWKGI